MDLPNLRHFTPDCISSDPVEVLLEDAWQSAVYTTKGWRLSDGTMLDANLQWRHGQEVSQNRKESGQGDAGVQSRNPAKRQTGTRQRAKSQKPKAGDSHCTI